MRTVGRMHRAARLARRRGLAGAALVIMAIAAGRASLVCAAPSRGAPSAKSATADAADKAPVDINAADAEKLATLPGVGPSIAQRIVEYRKEHGPFKSVDELVNVRGVGEKLLGRLREHVTVGAKE
jgi:competence protein ComEA